jgi:hypothetical protein
VYFGKHGRFKDKEYQNIPPHEWQDDVTRFWGHPGLKRIVESVEVSPAEAVEIRRLFRRMVHAKQVRMKVTVSRLVRPEVTDADSGEILVEEKCRRRTSHVRMELPRGGFPGSGYVLLNDGPEMMGYVKRYLDLLRSYEQR